MTISNTDLNRIIKEVVSLHRTNLNENGERARSKLSEVKKIIETHLSRIRDED